MTADQTPAPPDDTAGIPCPSCLQPAGDLQRRDGGMLAFTCRACGHQWWLFDRAPDGDSDR